jgi:hypothetical protein
MQFLYRVHTLWNTHNSRLFKTFQGQNFIKFKTIFRSISFCRHSKGEKWREINNNYARTCRTYATWNGCGNLFLCDLRNCRAWKNRKHSRPYTRICWQLYLFLVWQIFRLSVVLANFKTFQGLEVRLVKYSRISKLRMNPALLLEKVK